MPAIVAVVTDPHPLSRELRVAIGGPVETPGIDDDAAERIAMLADPLRGRMHGDVGPSSIGRNR